MAGGKKKKKLASNPARGFATTSVASKPRADVSDIASTVEGSSKPVTPSEKSIEVGTGSDGAVGSETQTKFVPQISPEEFEKQLEVSELQDLVDKHAQKSKREAARQISRLQTERRLLRNQADTLNTRKWLPPELIDGILEVITADSYAASRTTSPDNHSKLKSLSEEDLTIKLWTLQQTLDGIGFSKEKILLVLDYILGVSDKISIGNKESIWGLEESLEWLALECARDELSDYDSSQIKLKFLKSQTGMSILCSSLSPTWISPSF